MSQGFLHGFRTANAKDEWLTPPYWFGHLVHLTLTHAPLWIPRGLPRNAISP